MTQFHNNQRDPSVRRCAWRAGAFFFANSLVLVPHWDLHCRTAVWWRRGVWVCVCYTGRRNPFDWSSGLGRPHLILRQELQRRQEQLLAMLWKCHQAKGHYTTHCFMNPLLYAQTHNHANTHPPTRTYTHNENGITGHANVGPNALGHKGKRVRNTAEMVEIEKDKWRS